MELVKLDYDHRQMAERVLDRIGDDENEQRAIVYVLVVAEEALALATSLRAPEQAKCQRALELVRSVINGTFHRELQLERELRHAERAAPIEGYSVFNGGQGD
jgi:hypothetical protein